MKITKKVEISVEESVCDICRDMAKEFCAVCRKDICKKCIGESSHGFFVCKICSENYKLNHHWNDVMGIIDKRIDKEVGYTVSLD
jgi:hypothetical protein